MGVNSDSQLWVFRNYIWNLSWLLWWLKTSWGTLRKPTKEFNGVCEVPNTHWDWIRIRDYSERSPQTSSGKYLSIWWNNEYALVNQSLRTYSHHYFIVSAYFRSQAGSMRIENFTQTIEFLRRYVRNSCNILH